ncbi:MAG: hypothetical protein IT310_07850 [Anaerolineales bacterium]|nr:hypothetical protein [Anaerolineales bacterium]
MLKPTTKKPIGQPTRGKTAANRLRRVDNFILLYEPALLTRTDGLFADSIFIDLGYGFDPRTTLESAQRFRRLNPNLKILGVEIDKERVAAALPHADEKTFFRLGGFNLPVRSAEQVRLIRAFNVLRQYEERDFIPAYERLSATLLPGGLLIEGTSNPFGSLWAANLFRKQDSQSGRMEALVFSLNFKLDFEVGEFQTILPKNYIHRMTQGERIYDFFEAWKQAAAETAHTKIFGQRQWFGAACEKLAGYGFEVSTKNKWLSKGYLIWNNP